MLNFGLRELWLVAPRCRIDNRSYALASHAAEVLDSAKVVDDLEEALAGMTMVAGTSARVRAADNYIVRSPRQAAAALTGTSAVLFGPEDHGLSNQDLTRCQLQVVIPTADFSSLNLAQAVLVMAYELGVARGASGAGGDLVAAAPADSAPDNPAPAKDSAPGNPAPANSALANAAPAKDPAGDRGLATRDQVEQFYAQLQRTMLRIGYTDPPRAPSVMRMYRGLLDRAGPSAHELAALRGLASQVDWAARQPPKRLPAPPLEAAPLEAAPLDAPPTSAEDSD